MSGISSGSAVRQLEAAADWSCWSLLGLVAAPRGEAVAVTAAVLVVATWRELWSGRVLSDGGCLGEGAASVALWSPWREEETEGGGWLSGAVLMVAKEKEMPSLGRGGPHVEEPWLLRG